jgi:hypothetical protein
MGCSRFSRSWLIHFHGVMGNIRISAGLKFAAIHLHEHILQLDAQLAHVLEDAVRLRLDKLL